MKVNERLYQDQSWLHEKYTSTVWKVSKYGVFSGPYFPVFAQNKEIYGVNLRTQSKYRKIRTRKKSTFHGVEDLIELLLQI